MEGLHRLEGSSGGMGGLVVRKKDSNKEKTPNHDSSFKPLIKGSILGLDKLAAAKRIEEVSFKVNSKNRCFKILQG